ncbi:MAG: hypothetical protein ABI986_14665 [Chloroflexota bacterium]
MSEHCGTTTEEGNAVCIPGECSCDSESKNSQVSLSAPSTTEGKDVKKQTIVKVKTGASHVDENS